MAAKRRGPAQREGTEHALLRRRGDVAVSRQIGRAILPYDIRHFEGGASHRSVSSTRATSGCSKGLGVACSV